MEDLLESLAWASPYLIVAAIMYSIYLWKTSRGKNLLAKAQSLIDAGQTGQAAALLKEALWRANEKGELERTILAELERVYQSHGIVVDSRDYILLIEQFEALAAKGSTKALTELKEVLALKKTLIDRMPDIG